MSKYECQHSPRTAALLVTPVIGLCPHCPPPPLLKGEGLGLPSELRACNKGPSSLWVTFTASHLLWDSQSSVAGEDGLGNEDRGEGVCAVQNRCPKVAVRSDNDNNSNNNNNTLSTSYQPGHYLTESGNSIHCTEAVLWHD